MASRIWEHVAANRIEVGDILAWNDDTGSRVTVYRVDEHPGPEVLPYIRIGVQGPDVAFERMSGVRTVWIFRQGDAVMRMKRDHAARVGPNLRTVVRPVQPPSVVTNLSDLTPAMRSGLANWNTAPASTRRALIGRGFVQGWGGELTPAGERAREATCATVGTISGGS